MGRHFLLTAAPSRASAIFRASSASGKGQIEQGRPELYKATLARNPTGRMATPQEVANAAVFLASPASGFTTGINMVVDGAITSRVNF